MQPALNPGDRGHRDAHSDFVLVSKWRRIVHNPGFERGDVVTLAAPDGSRDLVKRVVGLEGDWIHTADGRQVYITRGLCWVESDNRGGCAAPCDSNEFGPVPVALLRGTVKRVLWPPSRWWAPVRAGLPDSMGPRRLQHILRGPEALRDDFLWKNRRAPR